MVQTKNRVSGLLLETGVEHNKSRLHKVGYFRRLLGTNSEVDDSIRPLLRISRETIERCQKTDYALVSSLERDPLLKERIRRLRTVPGVGPITALSWALEMGDISRFRSIKQAVRHKNCPDKTKTGSSMRRLPGPADCRLSEGANYSGGSLRIASGLAENTNSIFCDGSREPEAANGCPVLREQEPPAERHRRTTKPDITHCAFSRTRPEHLCSPLTKDSHGCRQYFHFKLLYPYKKSIWTGCR
jgi:hypothetical protein